MSGCLGCSGAAHALGAVAEEQRAPQARVLVLEAVAPEQLQSQPRSLSPLQPEPVPEPEPEPEPERDVRNCAKNSGCSSDAGGRGGLPRDRRQG